MSKDKEHPDFYRMWERDEGGRLVLDQMATYKANRHLLTSNYKLDSLSKKDVESTKILAVDPGSRPFAWAVLLLDEQGSIVQPKINIYGPSGPPGWIPSDAFPPGFPFWDIPTTLMVTDSRVKRRLKILINEDMSGIKLDTTAWEELFQEVDGEYSI